MRNDSTDFAAANTAVTRQPRYVVQILFSDSSPSFTSRLGISGVPGDVYEETIAKISSISQQVWPEEGRTTIGSLTVELVETDGNGITEELRSQLVTLDPADAESARDKELRIYCGFSDTFADFQLLHTMFVSGVSFAKNTYRIEAKDKTWYLRTTILEPKETVLTATISAAATTITVAGTSEFEMIPHGASFQDAPGATVGYARLEDTGEIFRYTGKTSTTFTGVTRGVFGTKAQEVPFDSNDSRDAWPKVTEIIYLELPGPLAIIAVLTGVLDTSSPAVVLPDHWHMGLQYATDLSLSSFLNIGTDLFDPADYSIGFPVRFIDPGSTDGKAFVEKQLCQLLGVYMVARSDGRLALRRMNRVLPENGFVAKLDATNMISHGDLKHDYAALLNAFRLDYNWNGEDFTRSTVIIDTASVATYGEGDRKVLSFKGLHTARHTERAIKQQLSIFRERYAAPPLRLPVKCDPTTNAIEIGDIVRVAVDDLHDFTIDQAYLDRTFEVQKATIDWDRGEVDFELFASTTPPLAVGGNDDNTHPLSDAWYISSGTNIATLSGYVAASGGSPAHLTAGLTLTGSASDLRASGSIWYHDGDLTIDAGVIETIVNQAQLRVKGFLQINGKIDGKARGFSGGTDPDSVGATSTGWTRAGTAGYLGPTRSGDGIQVVNFNVYDTDVLSNIPGVLLSGLAGGTSAPLLALDSTGGSLAGLPVKIQGSSGSSGGQVTQGIASGLGTVRANGGAGGASGAGLAIICRGLGFGPSGLIDLSGAAGGAPNLWGASVDAQAADGSPVYDVQPYSGGGGGGYPGTLYVFLDGDNVPYPDINASTFVANRGATTISGTAAIATYRMKRPGASAEYTELRYSGDLPELGAGQISGRNADWQGPAANMWTVAYQAQYVPAMPAAQEKPITPPSSLAVTGGLGQNTLRWTWPIGLDVADVEVYASSSNDRAFASLVAEVVGGSFSHSLPTGGTRYYWIRCRGKVPDQRASAWYPSGATSGVSGTAAASETTQNPLTIRANKSTYTTTTSGSIYLHGFDSLGNPVDGPAEVNHNGGIVAVSAGTLATSQNVDEGWIIFETSGATPFTVGGVSKPYACARKSRSGWVYDNGSAWTAFTATSTMVAVGTYARSGGSITSVAALGNAMVLSSVPYENATQVQPGDIQPGAISDLANFASTIRPIKIVSSLPTLPDTTNYPDGSLVLLTSDHKVYRADYSVSPDAWIKTVDGADIIAGTVTAAALVADLVLGTLIRTASSNERVELEGNSHAFPFWIGTGTKGTVSGTPGSGAKVYYDRTANEFAVTGKLVSSFFQQPTSGNASYILSTADKQCAASAIALGGLVSMSSSSDSAWVYGGAFFSSSERLLPPDGGTATTDQHRRLPVAQQPFTIVVSGVTYNSSGSANVDLKVQYSYDAGANWYDAVSWNLNCAQPGFEIREILAKPKSGFSGSETLDFRLGLRNTGAAAVNGFKGKYMVFLDNITGSSATATTLT